MNLRKELQITLEEEEFLVKEVFETFKEMFDQSGSIKIGELITRALTYDLSDNSRSLDLSYHQSFNIGTIQMILNKYRRDKKKSKKINYKGNPEKDKK